jgi:hypothetical protein
LGKFVVIAGLVGPAELAATILALQFPEALPFFLHDTEAVVEIIIAGFSMFEVHNLDFLFPSSGFRSHSTGELDFELNAERGDVLDGLRTR